MEKRLTRNEMLFSLGFLFMLIFAVGAFFYGMKLGSDKTEAKFLGETKQLAGGKAAAANAYQQQDLVSFYHTVFLPYREFHSDWFDTIHKLKTGQLSDPASAFKELHSFSNQSYVEVERASVPATSPLLEQAQLQLLKALKLLGEATDNAISSAGAKSSSEVVKELMNDAYYTEGVEHANGGQESYYNAMLKWGSSVDPNIPDHYDDSGVLDIQNWKPLALTVKNMLMAEQLKARGQLVPFYPQDLTSRIDQFISSGQAGKMKLKSVDAIVDLLIGTDAVRTGDFSDSKNQLYASELLPQLPFFFPE
jgi:hypothetical protein